MQLGSWAPDLPEAGHNELVTARNAYSGPLGYRPVPAPGAVTGALPETWTGAGAFQGLDGTKVLLAGTNVGLYLLTTAATLKRAQTVTKPWYFAQFGDLVIGVNGLAPIKYTIATATAALLAGSPPNATLIAIVRDFVFLAGNSTAGNTVYWSGLNNAEGWTPGTNQSDIQVIPDGGNITGLAGGEYGLVFQSGAIHLFEYVGTPLIYTRRKVSDSIGAICQGTIAQDGKVVFFLSRKGFYSFLDGELSPIGKDRVDQTFFNTYSFAEIQLNCHATVDPARKLVIWSMPDRLWIYNYANDKWSDVYYPGIIGVANGQTSDVTLEYIATLYPSIENVPVSFDDPLWRGGDPMLLIAMNDNKLYSFGGASNMEAKFRMARSEPYAPNAGHYRNARIGTDATTGVTLNLDCRERLGDMETRVTTTDIRANGDMPIRARGRYMQPELLITAGTVWTFVESIDLEGTRGSRQ